MNLIARFRIDMFAFLFCVVWSSSSSRRIRIAHVMRHDRFDCQVAKMTHFTRILTHHVTHHQNDSFHDHSNDFSKLRYHSRLRHEREIEYDEIRSSTDRSMHDSKQSRRDAMNIRSSCVRHENSLHQHVDKQCELNEKSNSIQTNEIEHKSIARNDTWFDW